MHSEEETQAATTASRHVDHWPRLELEILVWQKIGNCLITSRETLTTRATTTDMITHSGIGLNHKFHGSSFFVASSWHPRRHARHSDIIATREDPHGVMLPVRPCVVSFCKFHEPNTHLRNPLENVTIMLRKKRLLCNASLKQLRQKYSSNGVFSVFSATYHYA